MKGLVRTGIEWCIYTWTVVHGCSYISEGCQYCYAFLAAVMKQGITKTYAQGFRVTMEMERLLSPFKLTERAIIFLSSMGDLFHIEKQTEEKWTKRKVDGGQITSAFIKMVFTVMNGTQHLVYMVLTKRPNQALKVAHELEFTDNIMMGVSVESPKYFSRIGQLKELPGAGPKFLSLEPAIAPYIGLEEQLADGKISLAILGGESYDTRPETLVDQKIEGGLIEASERENAIAAEIALRASREMTVENAIAVKEACRRTGVNFFFKQYGYRGSRKPHRLLPDVTVSEYTELLATNGWSDKTVREQIDLIGKHPELFRARTFNEFPEPGLSILKEQRPELFEEAVTV